MKMLSGRTASYIQSNKNRIFLVLKQSCTTSRSFRNQSAVYFRIFGQSNAGVTTVRMNLNYKSDLVRESTAALALPGVGGGAAFRCHSSHS